MKGWRVGIIVSVFFVSALIAMAGPNRVSPVKLKLGSETLVVNPNSKSALRSLLQKVEQTLLTTDTKTKKEKRGLQAMQRIIGQLLAEPVPQGETQHALVEVALALGNNRRFPVPHELEFFQVPWAVLDHYYSPIAKGRAPATDLAESSNTRDASRIDPVSSSFWTRRESIGSQDLYFGFGRTNGTPLARRWHYAEAKTGFGVNPGFEIEADGMHAKVKFGETHSEPFAARLFAALGYHADPTDYLPSIELSYDRRLFLEFNSRRPIETRFSFLGIIPLYRMRLTRQDDPFAYIARARFKNGLVVSGTELKRRLLVHDGRLPLRPDSFRVELENQIESLTTVPVNFQIKDSSMQTIGPWDFGQMDHADHRELRGAGLLAAWLGWCDSRFDNTRLRMRPEDGQLLHYFSDLGGGLGRNGGTFFWQGEQPQEFPWEFTRSGFVSNRLGARDWFRIIEFKPIEDTEAFASMTTQDARWMGRMIGQLSEEQITQALVASGFESAIIRLYVEKLVSRRDRMLHDLKLDTEFAAFRPNGPNRGLDYDPFVDGPMRVTLPSGEMISAPIGSFYLRAGRLEEHPSAYSRATPSASARNR